MEAHYYDQLPLPGKALVDTIEQYSGKVIGVFQRPGAASNRINELIADVTFENIEAIPPADAVHELLHIQRNWPEQVPQLFATGGVHDARKDQFAALDNDLEHISISPRQRDLGFDPAPFWNQRLGEKWRGGFWAQAASPAHRRFCLLRGALNVGCLASDAALKTFVDKILQQQGLLNEAQQFLSEIGSGLSKPEMAACAMYHLQIPRKWARLVVFDVRAETDLWSDLPAWPKVDS